MGLGLRGTRKRIKGYLPELWPLGNQIISFSEVPYEIKRFIISFFLNWRA